MTSKEKIIIKNGEIIRTSSSIKINMKSKQEQINNKKEVVKIKKKQTNEIKEKNEIKPTTEIKEENEIKEDEPEKICRICYDLSSPEELFNPCHCDGSIKYVHQSCLEKWIKISKNEVCQQCKHKYKFETKYKYKFHKYIDNKYTPKILTVLLIILLVFISGLIVHVCTKVLFPKRAKTLNINLKYMLDSTKYFTIFFFIFMVVGYYSGICNVTEIFNEYLDLTQGYYVGGGGSELGIIMYITFYSKIKEKFFNYIKTENKLLNIEKNKK